jgi:ribosome-binding protein aMBF1 (putative translation factor)
MSRPRTFAELTRAVTRSGNTFHKAHTKHEAALQDVADQMRRAREARGIGVRDLAKVMGCSSAYLSDMERGNRKYSITWIRAAAAHLSNYKPQ